MTSSTIQVGASEALTLEKVVRFSLQHGIGVALSSDREFRERINAGREFCVRSVRNGADIYGVTTGFGGSANQKISHELARQLQINLTRYHGCGLGEPLNEAQCAASLLIRLSSHTRGFSGVSWELLERMSWMLDQRVIPVIPALGSVGASGDLTPLSYIAAAIQGERQVYWNGGVSETSHVLRSLGMEPYPLQEKEGLAIMNGTSVMTAIASLSWADAKRLAELACDFTGLIVEALEGRSSPFEERLQALKPHKGQMQAARHIYDFIACPEQRRTRKAQLADGSTPNLQDYYSIRCAPQVIGVLYDVLEWSKSILETEMNGASDNPLFFADAELILNGGQFYGGHVAAACDALKTASANVLALMDRQLAVLLDSRFNDVFADNLVDQAALGLEASVHHGFKAAQITVSALVAEALKNAQPMSIFSRPTENSNQDIVSMGTIAARDLDRILYLGKSVSSIMALAIKQAHHLREQGGGYKYPLNNAARSALRELAPHFEPVIQDRPLEGEIRHGAEDLFAANRVIACMK